MSKILTFAWKELYTTFRDRNLILIMFLTPIILSTIMGLAFGGLGSDSDSSAFSDIPIAIVNLDEGFNFGENIPTEDGQPPTLNDLEFELNGETVNVGELFLQNENLDVEETDLAAGNASFNFGEQLTNILLSEAVTATENSTDTTAETSTVTAFNLDDLNCPLVEDTPEEESPFGFEGTLADLFDAEVLTDLEAARIGVERGEYVAAIIIPAAFSNALSPTFDFGEDSSSSSSNNENDDVGKSAGVVEIYANSGQSIQATIVRAVVQGIVNQFVRISVAIDSVFITTINTAANQLFTGELDLTALNVASIQEGFQSVDSSILEPLGCLLLPDTGNIQLSRQPLDTVQEGSAFGFIMVILGSAQAIFFALFTGIFGMNSIYEERSNWTLQRLFAAPMPRFYILIGKMLGNIVVVAAQLVVLFIAFTVITSLVEGEPTFIWGTNVPLLALTILAISLFVSGVGVLIVGLAATPEQVQTFGPIVSAGLGALGGSFGFRLPPQVAGISPIWWGSEAVKRLAAGDTNILMPLAILLGSGLLLFAIGSVFFKRRMEL
ncbi:MAG: ABC transporter permease [Chloroflexota bacterium]